MNWITAGCGSLALLATALIAPAGATEAGAHWRAFVCRVTDWHACEQNRNNKRIYPGETLYPDKDTCLEAFAQRFEQDPEISGKFPQTKDASHSYVFDCEAVR
ncbi:MAG: hypothetical protein PVI50_08010 [Gammaproteobacteria bacterium]|jgi:hypothetical protein